MRPLYTDVIPFARVLKARNLRVSKLRGARGPEDHFIAVVLWCAKTAKTAKAAKTATSRWRP